MRRARAGPGLRAGFDRAAGDLASVLDPEQQPVADRLAQLGADLSRRRRHQPRGAYLHGPVGRGKTWLVDVLLAQLPADGVLRLHAYESARRLHREVARQTGRPGAVDRAVDALLDGVRLLFLDELHAHDPGDAMLLARLVRALPERRAVLVATSNYPPRGLLPDPRHHHLVRPLVEQLERPRWSSGAWLAPGSAAQLAARGLAAPQVGDGVRLVVAGRELAARAASDSSVWLTFDALCRGLTGLPDVLALGDRYDTVVLDGVPLLAAEPDDARRRFADLVDVLWDRDVRLVVLAAGPPQRVLDAEVRDRARTLSRLSLLAAG